MPRMPHQWLGRCTEADIADADALTQLIDEAMDRDGPCGDARRFIFELKPKIASPNKRVQDEIIRRYKKSESVPQGWGDVVFNLKAQDGNRYIEFCVDPVNRIPA